MFMFLDVEGVLEVVFWMRLHKYSIWVFFNFRLSMFNFDFDFQFRLCDVSIFSSSIFLFQSSVLSVLSWLPRYW